MSGPQKTRLSSVGKVQRALQRLPGNPKSNLGSAYGAGSPTIQACTAPIGGTRAEPISGPMRVYFARACAGIGAGLACPWRAVYGPWRAMLGAGCAPTALAVAQHLAGIVAGLCGPTKRGLCAGMAGLLQRAGGPSAGLGGAARVALALLAFLVLSYAQWARASPVSFVASQRATMRAYKLTLRAALRTGSNR